MAISTDNKDLKEARSAMEAVIKYPFFDVKLPEAPAFDRTICRFQQLPNFNALFEKTDFEGKFDFFNFFILR